MYRGTQMEINQSFSSLLFLKIIRTASWSHYSRLVLKLKPLRWWYRNKNHYTCLKNSGFYMGYLISSLPYSQKSLQFKRSGSPHQLWAACCFARSSAEINDSSKLLVLLGPEPGWRCWLHPVVEWGELQLSILFSLTLPLFPMLSAYIGRSNTNSKGSQCMLCTRRAELQDQLQTAPAQ